MEKGELNWAVIGCGVIANEMTKLRKECGYHHILRRYGDIHIMI